MAETAKQITEQRQLIAEEAKLRRDTGFAPLIVAGTAGAGILAVLQLVFKALGWIT